MIDPVTVPLVNGASGEFVDACLWRSVDEAFGARADDLWLTFLAAWRADQAQRGQLVDVLEHEHWNWQRKLRLRRSLLAFTFMGLECDGEPQGMMCLLTASIFARTSSELGRPLVYVDYLAAAPWNLSTAMDTPRYRGVGTAMLRAAVMTSIELEFKGRIGLHSLQESESFYESKGMKCFGREPTKQNLKYYEFSPTDALAFVRDGERL